MRRDTDGAGPAGAAQRCPGPQLWPDRQQGLLLTAATGDDTAAVEAFGRWRRSVDLEAEIDGGSYRLLPLVYHHMHRLGIRDPLMRRLKGIYRMSWCGNQVLLDKARPLVSSLTQRGITIVLLQDIALATSYYRNFAARPIPSLAIAVPSSQIGRSIAAIEAFGWRANASPSAEDLKYRSSVRFTDGSGLQLDLHWHFLGELCNDAADAFFWSSTIPLDFGGKTTLQLDPTATLLHVVLHGIRGSREPPVRWISDALAIFEREDGRFDWERMIAFARSQRLTYRLLLGLGHLAEQHNAPVPQEVLTRLRGIPASLVERLEDAVVLRARLGADASPFAKQWMILVDFCRSTSARGPIEFVIGLSHYLRYRSGLDRRRDLIAAIPRRLMRRLGRIRL